MKRRVLGLVVRLFLLALIIAALLKASDMAYEDEQAAFAHTCDMIHAGAWPPDVEPACGREEP